MLPDEPNDEERLEALPEDGQTPFQPADPNPDTTGNTTDPIVEGATNELPNDNPVTDSNIDSTELYDAGISGATGVSDNSSQTAVTSYDPASDQSTDDEDELTNSAL